MPGEPGSAMDMKFCADVHRIADALDRIVASLERISEAADISLEKR